MKINTELPFLNDKSASIRCIHCYRTESEFYGPFSDDTAPSPIEFQGRFSLRELRSQEPATRMNLESEDDQKNP